MREKKPERRAGVNREIHKWAFGDIDDNGNVSVLEMNDDDKPLLKMKFNSLNSKIRDDIKNHYAQYYDKLFSK